MGTEPSMLPRRAAESATPAVDPFNDFSFDDQPNRSPNMPGKEAAEKKEACTNTLATRRDHEKSKISAAVNQQKRTGWDPDFDHPYAGALKSNGLGVYCRPCQRWIQTYDTVLRTFSSMSSVCTRSHHLDGTLERLLVAGRILACTNLYYVKVSVRLSVIDEAGSVPSVHISCQDIQCQSPTACKK